MIRERIKKINQSKEYKNKIIKKNAPKKRVLQIDDDDQEKFVYEDELKPKKKSKKINYENNDIVEDIDLFVT